MPRLRFTEQQVRDRLGAGLRPSAENAADYADAFPGLQADLAEFMAPTATSDIPGTPTSPTTPAIPGAGQYDEDPRLNQIINELLNPPEVFGDVSRRAAEVAAGRGIAGSEAGFGTGLRMTEEEKLRRIAMGAGLVGERETSRYKQEELSIRGRELDLRAEQIRADIALGNRTAANQEELTRIQQERAQIERDLAQLQRDIQSRLGTPNSTASAAPFDPGENFGMWVWG